MLHLFIYEMSETKRFTQFQYSDLPGTRLFLSLFTRCPKLKGLLRISNIQICPYCCHFTFQVLEQGFLEVGAGVVVGVGNLVVVVVALGNRVVVVAVGIYPEPGSVAEVGTDPDAEVVAAADSILVVVVVALGNLVVVAEAMGNQVVVVGGIHLEPG